METSDNPSSLPSSTDPYLLMAEASGPADMRAVMRDHEAPVVAAAWARLPLVQSAALLLTRAFPESKIIRDCDDQSL
jgi:hypothetical protein